MRDMEGKIALVAAGSKGLGRASALKMAMRGAAVAIARGMKPPAPRPLPTSQNRQAWKPGIARRT